MKEAYLYEKLKEQGVRCILCNHRCIIADGKRGLCNVRENRSGTLVSLVYEKIIATHCDPIEKKNPCSISFPGVVLIPSPRWAAISVAFCVRTRISPRCPPTITGSWEK